MKLTKILLTATAISLLLISGCKKDNKADLIIDDTLITESKPNTHNWYYFSDNGYSKIDKPENAPYKPQLPWTEAVRLSSASTTSPSEDTLVDGKAFAVVNRLGILCFNDKEITLSQDANIFNDRTAGNLFFSDNTPLFSVYKNYSQ